jgi:hypothetical protein
MGKDNFSKKYVLDLLRLYDKYNPHEKIIGLENKTQSLNSKR